MKEWTFTFVSALVIFILFCAIALRGVGIEYHDQPQVVLCVWHTKDLNLCD